MTKLKYLIPFVILLITSCARLPSIEPTSTPPISLNLMVTHSPTETPQPTTVLLTPTPTHIQFGKLQCASMGHITAWDSLSDKWLNTYTGSFDNKTESVGMTIVYSGNSMKGVFFYANKPYEIKIDGCLQKDRKFILYIYDENDKKLAIVKGEFPEVDPYGGYHGRKLDREVLIGTWMDERTDEISSFYLKFDSAVGGTLEHQYEVAGALDDKIVDQAAQDFLNAVAADDREFVAEMVEYPIQVSISQSSLTINNQDEFLFYYEKIFTDSYKAQLAKLRPKHMFAKWSGIMMGQGEVWFNAYGKIIALYTGSGG